ncbi:MAG: hypothetical protein ACK41C_03385 [Phenylobacterium sp.]|uniref:hypothetical protein n=1 Tax=Phenylobacterium sp. TaxID=1871053 RepID=UPI00391BE226
MALSRPSSSRPALRATRARQGRFGRHVLWVLLASLALALLALFGAWTWQADELARTTPNTGREPADAEAFSAPPPQPRQNTVDPASGPPR